MAILAGEGDDEQAAGDGDGVFDEGGGKGRFKTPTLREIRRTAPYMHDGSIGTLEEVMEYYDRGGNRNPALDPEIRPLYLSPAEKRALVTFLSTLSSKQAQGTSAGR